MQPRQPHARPDVGSGPRSAWLACLPLVLALALEPAEAGPLWEPSGWSGTERTSEEEPDAARDRDQPDGQANEEKQGNGFQKAVDAVHAGISIGVEATAKRVDSFFADDRYYADSTDTYASLGARGTWESSDDDDYVARVRVRLDLPGTEERIRLFIEGGDPDDNDISGATSIPRAFDDPDYNIGLEARLEHTGRWDIRPGAGITSGSPLDVFVRLRATRYEPLGDWLMRFSAGAAEYVDDGTELQTRLDFDRQINDRLLFRSATRARYRDSKDHIDITQQFNLFQKVGNRTAVAYGTGVRFDDDPDWEVDQYFAQVRIRTRAYKKWLFLEATPEIVFREEDDFDPTGRLSLAFDAVFGERYR